MTITQRIILFALPWEIIFITVALVCLYIGVTVRDWQRGKTEKKGR
jgi:ABC-type multidrug transport system permease subunit